MHHYLALSDRLGTFAQVLNQPMSTSQSGINVIDSRTDSYLALEHVTLLTPDYQRTLIKNLSVTVQSKSGLLIYGPSGSGKSSLVRAIAGLRNAGSGLIIRPELDEMLFLPQRPYMVLGSLRTQLLYPRTSRHASLEQLYSVLEQVNLKDLPERIGGMDVELNWTNFLSLGEQQRLAFARVLLIRPRYTILDEATSALDEKNEAWLYQQMLTIPATFISIAHRSSLLPYHQQILELKGDSSWQLTPVEN